MWSTSKYIPYRAGEGIAISELDNHSTWHDYCIASCPYSAALPDPLCAGAYRLEIISAVQRGTRRL